jgi:tetratricopeptide (TPR) repeat protein
LHHYQEAIRISPHYADAHYNLALLFQGLNQPMKAVRHWTEYLKLDPASQWASIARRELDKLRDAAVVQGSRA